MEKRAEHLATLGLAPDASWDEVTQAYKDLMRVWHPDRFQGDERLCKKAEFQAQRINHAMGELRKMGKNATATAGSGPRTTSTTANTASTRAQPNHNRAGAHTDTSKSEGSNAQASFLIAPLYVRQRFTTSIFRVAAASAIFYLAIDILRAGSDTTSQEAASLGFAFLALDFGVRNLTVMLLPKPVVSVERGGLFFLKTGRLSWADIESAWPVITPRSHQINLLLSQHYVSKQNIAIRTLLKFRRWMKTPHIVVPFNGLTTDPVSVINAMRLRQIHHDVAIEEPAPKPRGLLAVALLVSVVCVSVAIVRCLLELTISPFEYVPYFFLFALARGTGVLLRVFKS